MFNLNASRKKEYTLNENQISEVISMYGMKCKYLFTEKINTDFSVFKDFSHLKVGKDFADVYLLPENTENWENDVNYNMFGFHNQWTQHFFISKKSMYELFPNFLETGRHELVNSLILTPSGTLLEVTHVESFGVGINNLWGYSDQPSSYKLSVKIYDNNISDEGITSIKTSIELQEGGSANPTEIFSSTEDIGTSDIDSFFASLEVTKNNIQKESTTGTKKGTGSNNTDNPFGSLG